MGIIQTEPTDTERKFRQNRGAAKRLPPPAERGSQSERLFLPDYDADQTAPIASGSRGCGRLSSNKGNRRD
ncbi:MAG: hypothetical protein RIQ93_1587 [Verrucomicrobiota bacterium]|jgi:hypothetical protein